MHILGNLLKQTLNLTATLQESEKDPVKSQKQTLRELLSKARDTQFGKDYAFGEMADLDDPRAAYHGRVPMFDYHKMQDEYWHALHEGAEDVSWPGKPDYFALSSGTTGSEPKRIPVSNDMIASIRNAGIHQLLSLKNFDLPPEVFEKQVLMLGSSTNLKERGDHLEGEISGIGASNIPDWFDFFYKPGKDIAAIKDWDERLDSIAHEAPNWDIGALSGIPSWVQLMLEKIIEVNQLENIHDLWPNLTVYTTGGVAFEPYKAGFEKLLAHPLIYMDTYLASEGFFGYNSRPETDAMTLVLDNGVYYEFLPFGPAYFDSNGIPKKEVPSVSIDKLEANKDYALIISTCTGAWRYMIGDTISFTDPQKLEFRITGRTQGFLNVVGSQLSEQKLNSAIRHLEEKTGTNVREYTVGAIQEENSWKHRWYIGMEGDLDENEVADVLDSYLRNRNKAYNMARDKALKGVEVRLIKPYLFYDYQEKKKKKGGQVKMPRVLSGEKWEDWMAFLG